jgi:hypothetical protein
MIPATYPTVSWTIVKSPPQEFRNVRAATHANNLPNLEFDNFESEISLISVAERHGIRPKH